MTYIIIQSLVCITTYAVFGVVVARCSYRRGYRRGVNDLRDHLLAHLAPDQSRESLDIRLLAIQVRANQLGVDKAGRVP